MFVGVIYKYAALIFYKKPLKCRIVKSDLEAEAVGQNFVFLYQSLIHQLKSLIINGEAHIIAGHPKGVSVYLLIIGIPLAKPFNMVASRWVGMLHTGYKCLQCVSLRKADVQGTVNPAKHHFIDGESRLKFPQNVGNWFHTFVEKLRC